MKILTISKDKDYSYLVHEAIETAELLSVLVDMIHNIIDDKFPDNYEEIVSAVRSQFITKGVN